MHIAMFDDLLMDARRALWMPRQHTLVIGDFFFGLGASRRRNPDAFPTAAYLDPWERLMSLIDDYRPERIVVLGNIKPNQGTLTGDEAEELDGFLNKLTGTSRTVVQVVNQLERSLGPAIKNPRVKIVDRFQLETYHFMHRRHMFVYPKLDNREIWINGGVHPVFGIPSLSSTGQPDWMRTSGFLFTGFAVVFPAFVSYAQGHEVFLPKRLPRQAKGYKLLSDRLFPIDLSTMPDPPEALQNLARAEHRSRESVGQRASGSETT